MASGATKKTDEVAEKQQPEATKACFIIMPISDQDGYRPGHFKEVYDDLIAPTVREAGYEPIRADQVHATNMIHLDILGRLLDAPLAICDLSSVNPNVMFELGIRQAFDKPVVLLKDAKTRNPFDIAPMRYVEYDGALSYRGMLAAREGLLKAIQETAGAKPGENINSIVGLLGLREAAIKPSDASPESARMALLEKMIGDISADVKKISQPRQVQMPVYQGYIPDPSVITIGNMKNIDAMAISYIDGNSDVKRSIFDVLTIGQQEELSSAVNKEKKRRASVGAVKP